MQVGSRKAQRRERAECEAGRQSHGGGEGENLEIHARAGQLRQVGRQNVAEEPAQRQRQDQPGAASGECQQQALGQQLPHEGLDCLDVPATSDSAGCAAIDGYVAASVTYLMGAYLPAEHLAWLRERQPVAKIGYSIYVYDLRKQR